MKTQKTLKKVTDRKILTSLPLLRLEKEYLNAAKEKDHSNAKKIIKSFHQNYFPNLTVTGRRKLAKRLAKITDILNKQEKYIKMIDGKEDKVHRAWDMIEYKCHVCGIKSNSKFPKIHPCKHETICAKCQDKLTYCVTCKTHIDYQLTSKFRKPIEKQSNREFLIKEAQAEREKANKIIRMNSLRQRRELAMAGVKLEQKFQDEQAKSAKQKEQEDKLAIQAKAKALREGKSFKNVDSESKKLRQTRKSWIKRPEKIKLPDLHSIWHDRKNVTGRNGDGTDDQLNDELEIMERSGFRESDWNFDVDYNTIPFVLQYPSTPSSKLARDRARDIPAVAELEEIYRSDEDFTRQMEMKMLHEIKINIRERMLMIEEDFASSTRRLVNSTKTGMEYDSTKEIINSIRLKNIKSLKKMESVVFTNFEIESRKERYNRKEIFLHTLVSLLYNDHALKIYFQYCRDNKIYPDQKFVYKLHVHHRRKRFDKGNSDKGIDDDDDDDTALHFHGGRFASKQAKAIILVLPKLRNLKHISISEKIDNDIVDEFINKLINLKHLEKLELVGALHTGRGNGLYKYKNTNPDIVSNIGNNIGKLYKNKKERKEGLTVYDDALTSHVNKRRVKRVENVMEFYQKFQEFQSLTYLDLSSNNIGDQGLRGLVSKNGWKSPNLTVLKISKINISGLSGKNLAKLIIQLQNSKKQLMHNDSLIMDLVDISWNNLNLIGLKSFFVTLNNHEEKIYLNSLNITWVGLEEPCLKHVLSFLTNEKSATISNIYLLSMQNGEGGGHGKLSQESEAILNNGIKKHKIIRNEYIKEQHRLKEIARATAEKKLLEASKEK